MFTVTDRRDKQHNNVLSTAGGKIYQLEADSCEQTAFSQPELPRQQQNGNIAHMGKKTNIQEEGKRKRKENTLKDVISIETACKLINIPLGENVQSDYDQGMDAQG